MESHRLLLVLISDRPTALSFEDSMLLVLQVPVHPGNFVDERMVQKLLAKRYAWIHFSRQEPAYFIVMMYQKFLTALV